MRCEAAINRHDLVPTFQIGGRATRELGGRLRCVSGDPDGFAIIVNAGECIVAGDELLGLVRGFVYAGATSVVISLWDVHDESAAELMVEFYRRFVQGGSPVLLAEPLGRLGELGPPGSEGEDGGGVVHVGGGAWYW